MTQVVLDSLMITGFVAAMMLLIEYLNVLSSGEWSRRLARGRIGQYLLAAVLGATPGCLGAFTVVTLYSHGAVSFGSVVAAMIATSGDEAFVMLALIPKTALALMAILFVLGVLAGVRRRKTITFTTSVCCLDESCSSIRHESCRASD